VYLKSLTTPMTSMSVGVPRIRTEAQVKADGISSGEIFFGKFLVDHYGRGATSSTTRDHALPFWLSLIVKSRPSDDRHTPVLAK